MPHHTTAVPLAARYVGTPYVPGETDCWALARRVWREGFGLWVPPVPLEPQALRPVLRAFGSHPERQHWREVPAPAEGDAVLMARGVHACHVGVWVDGAILHALEGIGCVHTPPARLQGLRVLGYWRHERLMATGGGS